MSKNRIYYLLTLIILTGTIWIISSSSEVRIIPHLLKITKNVYIAAAIGCMVCYWITEAFILKALFKLSKVKRPFRSYMKIAMIGQYYNMITPFSSGGQPAQVYTMTSDYQIPFSLATSMTINKFMIYHIIVTVFSLLMSILHASFILEQSILSKTFILFGLLFNTLGILAIFMIFYNPFVVKNIVSFCLKILRKLKLCKKIRHETIVQYIDDYQFSLFTFLESKKSLAVVSAWSLAQVVVYYSVTYFVYLSFGLSKASLMDILALQSILYMAVNFIPTPGNAGASEGAFYLMFGIVFPADILLYAIILWRLIIYYFNLLATGSMVLGDHLSKRLKNKSPRTNEGQ